MKHFYILLLFFIYSLRIAAYTSDSFDQNRIAPKHEVRAVWLTTIGGIDWPHSYAQTSTSIEKQKNELRRILGHKHRAAADSRSRNGDLSFSH